MSTTQPIRNSDKLQEFKRYYQAVNPQVRNYALCVLGLNTALRITDMLHLRWGDVYDFSEKRFLTHITVMEQKTGKYNVIALNAAAKDALARHMVSLSGRPAPNTFLFLSRKGANQPIGRCQAFRIVKEAAEAVGLERNISCHSLRKTFGYHAWKQGTPPALLMNIYNHSSYQITKRYLGIEQDDKDHVFRNIAL